MTGPNHIGVAQDAILPIDFDDSPVPAFVIGVDHVVTHWNKACEDMTGIPAEKMVGTRDHWQPFYVKQQEVLADFLLSRPVSDIAEIYSLNRFRSVPLVAGAYEVEDFFPHLGESGRWISFAASPLRDSHDRVVGAIQTVQDVTEVRNAEEALHDAQVRLERLAGNKSAMLAPHRTLLTEYAEPERTGLPLPGATAPIGRGGSVESRAAAAAPALSAFFDGSPVPAFAIDAEHVVIQWNKACERTVGLAATEMVGTRNQWVPFYSRERPVLADLVVSGAIEEMVDTYYHGKFRRSPLIPGAYEAEDFFPQMGESGRWLFFSAAPLRDADGRIIGAIETLQDITRRKLAEKDLHKVQVDLEHLVARRTMQLAQANCQLEEDIRRREAAESELLRRNAELTELNAKLTRAQEQLMQSEKLASIGQLAAGVAHEINNPIGYVFSNFTALENYLAGLLEMLTAYESAESELGAPEVVAQLKELREKVELDYLKGDLPYLMAESREGIVRVRKIVQDLKDFSRADSSHQWQLADLHQGINSTLNVINNEIKYRADVIKEYGRVPQIECLPSQINQVILNVVVNAAQSIGKERGTITIRTGSDANQAWIEIGDTGCGIAKENMSRIFDPFFTTKPVGKGTGLGLSLSYGIVQKHRGQIVVHSEAGKGSTFRIVLPLRQFAAESGD